MVFSASLLKSAFAPFTFTLEIVPSVSTTKVMIPFKENVENNSLYFGIGDQDVLRFDVGKNELHYLEPYPINGINEKDIMKTILYDYCSFKQNIFNYTINL